MADIREEAAKPAKVSNGMESAQAVSIAEKILAEKFEAERAAQSGSTSVWAGCRMSKAKMPGATGKTSI